jgi:SAM-dependent methyltransferase
MHASGSKKSENALKNAEAYCDSFGLQWNLHCRTQLDSYSGLRISENRLFSSTNWSRELRGQRILEAGSGAGRFTEILLKTGATVYSFDYSSAVEANAKNNRGAGNLVLFRADIYRIPLRKASFDKVICLGVLQHTPDPRQAFLSLVEFIRPGGEIVVDVYKRDMFSLLHWKYILRPLLAGLDRNLLYRLISKVVPILIKPTRLAKKIVGPLGGRMFPIAEYSQLGLSDELNREWAVLDTFDMFAPKYDLPQTRKEVLSWCEEAGLTGIDVRYGDNGIVARARKPGPE